jgi:hypothetical protein
MNTMFPRMKLRTLMILIAFVAVVARGAYVSYLNRRLADYHHMHCDGIEIGGDPSTIEEQSREIEWHARMERQYRRAVWMPWMTIDRAAKGP